MPLSITRAAQLYFIVLVTKCRIVIFFLKTVFQSHCESVFYVFSDFIFAALLFCISDLGGA